MLGALSHSRIQFRFTTRDHPSSQKGTTLVTFYLSARIAKTVQRNNHISSGSFEMAAESTTYVAHTPNQEED
jgi:hypothetical protein